MITVHTVIVAQDEYEFDLLLGYLAHKGHQEGDGTLVVIREKLTVWALDFKQMDHVYMAEHSLLEFPGPEPPPPGHVPPDLTVFLPDD